VLPVFLIADNDHMVLIDPDGDLMERENYRVAFA